MATASEEPITARKISEVMLQKGLQASQAYSGLGLWTEGALWKVRGMDHMNRAAWDEKPGGASCTTRALPGSHRGKSFHFLVLPTWSHGPRQFTSSFLLPT